MPFPDNKEDLQVFVDDLTEQMERRFARMSTNIMTRMDQMGRRVDDLERDLHSLAVQAGVEASNNTNTNATTTSRKDTSSYRSVPLSLSPTGSSVTSGAVEI